MNFKQTVAAALLAGALALAFVGGVSADGPKPGSTVPTGTVTFTIDGPQMLGQTAQPDNEWKYIAIRRY